MRDDCPQIAGIGSTQISFTRTSPNKIFFLRFSPVRKRLKYHMQNYIAFSFRNMIKLNQRPNFIWRNLRLLKSKLKIMIFIMFHVGLLPPLIYRENIHFSF